MSIEYRKKPGKNWYVSFTNLSPELQSDLIATIHEWHESEDLEIRQSSLRAAPVITDRLVVGDRASLMVEFRSIHEHHQDYFCRLTQYFFDHHRHQPQLKLWPVTDENRVRPVLHDPN